MNTLTERSDIERDIDLREIAARLWSHRWWIVTSVLLFTSLFAAVAFLMTPVYRASTVVITAASERTGLGGALTGALGSLGGLASLADLGVGMSNSETEEALAVLKSREFTETFLRDRQLIPELFASRWDARNGRWKADREPPTPAKAYKYFSNNIRSVLRDKKTGLVTLQIDWKDRTEAAAWANELVQRLNAEMRARAISKTDASLGYLEKELNTTSVVATREAINRLIEAQIKQRMLANVTEEFAFRVVDRALPPDTDDPVRPKKLLLLAAGLVVGAAVGIFGVLFAGWLSAGMSGTRG